jgi:hypothetical protein
MAEFSTTMHGTAPELTPSERRMQRHLFGIRAKQIAPVPDAAMWCILRELRSAPELERFGLFLVGSRLDPGNSASDIDIILAPRPASAFTDARIESALWYCREYGLYRANPACLIDPSFRHQGPSFRAVPLLPGTVLQTAKLLSPKLARLVREGGIQHYRRVGRFTIVYWRQAGETSFYQKLPVRPFDGVLCPYLRPAIEVTRDLSPGVVPR